MQDYQQIKQIGRGSFGVVKLVKRIKDGKHFAWKQINYQKMTTRQKDQLTKQVRILRSLQHDNIVRYIDYILDPSKYIVVIIMEYYNGGDLNQYLKKIKKLGMPIPEQQIWKICYQLLLALHYCHNKTNQKGRSSKVLHRDIKPANILIQYFDNQFQEKQIKAIKQIKLGDFGLSRQLTEESVNAKTLVGTPYYMSPQKVNGMVYDQKSDIWSAGCIIYQIAAHRRPFEAKNQIQLGNNILKGQYSRIPLRYSQNLWQLIQNMMNKNVNKRYNATQLLINKMFEMRCKQNLLKDKIVTLKKRHKQLQQRQRQILLYQQITDQSDQSGNSNKAKRKSKSSYDKDNNKENTNFLNFK